MPRAFWFKEVLWENRRPAPAPVVVAVQGPCELVAGSPERYVDGSLVAQGTK